MYMQQLPLLEDELVVDPSDAYCARLASLLEGDLDFHDQDSSYASHNFHAFPAKFPPQLPRKFITALTKPGDVVLDPMMGSGTTVLEAFLLGRQAIGTDIDPLAVLLSKVKTTPLAVDRVLELGQAILKEATIAVTERREMLEQALDVRWDPPTQRFVDYWFLPETQIELMALLTEIERIAEAKYRAFFTLALSAVIITKSGGVSLALDLAHTRPHRAKIVLDQDGQTILSEADDVAASRQRFVTKNLHSALYEFSKRLKTNIAGVANSGKGSVSPFILVGNAQSLPVSDDSIDLIVTSPPYASNAIDYMRAHKFSLVWLGYPVDELGQKRQEYIGGDALSDVAYEPMPPRTTQIVREIAAQDPKKALVLHRYYSEMVRVLREMYRVLKPGKAALVVVGSSNLRGVDTETGACLAEIGEMLGFRAPAIGVRNLDRNRRMMPAGSMLDLASQIQQRMHQEYVIGFYKPEI